MPTPVRRPRRAVAAGAFLLLSAACHERAGGPDDRPGPVARRPLTSVEAAAVRASNAFAFGLLREVGGERAHRGQNLVLSPYSGAVALGMTANGAAGATRDEMLAALGAAGRPAAEHNATLRGLTAYLLGADPKVEFLTANAVWGQEGFPLRAGFSDTVRTYFGAEARTVRFGTAEGSRAINAWANAQTRGRIPKVFDDGEPGADARVVLANAVYFKGQWSLRFDPARTRPAPFALEGGAAANVPTMERNDTPIRAATVDGARVGELPYGDSAYVMTVVLPPAGVGIEAFAAGLTAERWDALVAALRPATMTVRLPKFSVTGMSRWEAPLQRLGMRAAFVPGVADFSPLSARCLPAGPDDCHVGLVQQNVDLLVDEEGTVAAAVTSVGVRVSSMPPTFAVDRPFVFAVRERASGAILFLGRVLDPRG